MFFFKFNHKEIQYMLKLVISGLFLFFSFCYSIFSLNVNNFVKGNEGYVKNMLM